MLTRKLTQHSVTPTSTQQHTSTDARCSAQHAAQHVSSIATHAYGRTDTATMVLWRIPRRTHTFETKRRLGASRGRGRMKFPRCGCSRCIVPAHRLKQRLETAPVAWPRCARSQGSQVTCALCSINHFCFACGARRLYVRHVKSRIACAPSDVRAF